MIFSRCATFCVAICSFGCGYVFLQCFHSTLALDLVIEDGSSQIVERTREYFSIAVDNKLISLTELVDLVLVRRIAWH